MASLTPYLLFDGHCREAMEFYKSCFGGELTVTKVKDSPAKDRMATGQHEKVIHARLKSDIVEISASDWLRPDQTPIRGNTVCLFLSGGTLRELKALFEKLSDGPKLTDPLQGLELLSALDSDTRLAERHRLEAVRAHLLEMTGDHEAAITHYRMAASRATSMPERNYLMMQAARLSELRSTDQ